MAQSNTFRSVSATEDGAKFWPEKINFTKSIPFILMHLTALTVIFVGISWFAVGFCLLMYAIRMFAITGGYHRYFSHRTYKTSRWFQFCLAWLGCSSAQMGPLWWAAHHRHHHRHSDTLEDLHPPRMKGFFWSHVGWIMCRRNQKTNLKAVRDWMKYPELKFLDNFHLIPPFLLAIAIFYLGMWLESAAPGLGTGRWQLLVWGFFVSTIILYHMTFTINSLAHVIGKQRYDTGDDSRNNFFLALITLGEGWHNNHHKYPHSEQQGFFWYEVDISHYVLKTLALFGLVWDIKKPPKHVYDGH